MNHLKEQQKHKRKCIKRALEWTKSMNEDYRNENLGQILKDAVEMPWHIQDKYRDKLNRV